MENKEKQTNTPATITVGNDNTQEPKKEEPKKEEPAKTQK